MEGKLIRTIRIKSETGMIELEALLERLRGLSEEYRKEDIRVGAVCREELAIYSMNPPNPTFDCCMIVRQKRNPM